MAKVQIVTSTAEPWRVPSKSAATAQVLAWIAAQGWKPFTFQKEAWKAYQNGSSLLIHSATGTGKTLAAWLGPIIQWMNRPQPNESWTRMRGKSPAPPMMVLWVTPLRALAGDTAQSLQYAIDGLRLPWTLESRTSDTPSHIKQRQKQHLPTALITTPESLSLMLSYPQAVDNFRYLRAIIVDEWHELLGTKRGVLLELALARLRSMRTDLQTCGISATLANLNEALKVLVGPNFTGPTSIIHGRSKKKLEITAALADRMERFPWAGHLGTKMAPKVTAAIDTAATTLIFTNTRNQSEQWYQEILRSNPLIAGQIALHHGSLDSDVRIWVEDALRSEKLRAVVCTSSLDLGVDFSAVDQVIQIGSPKGVARLLQRAGRSGHRPEAISKLLFVATNALELIELAAARTMIAAGQVEGREPIKLPYDLLVQHLVTRALASDYDRKQILSELRDTHAFAELSEADLEWTIAFAKHGGDTLARYDDYKKLEEDTEGRLHVSSPKVSRRHRASIGTIVGEISTSVRYMTGKKLGHVEESFIAKIKPGDTFLFAGRLLELVNVRDSVAWVKKGRGTPSAVPRWMGGRMPLSSQLAAGIRQQIELAAQGKYIGKEMNAVKSILEIQRAWSHLPMQDEFLIEELHARDGHHLFFFPFEGRLVHEGLAALVAHRISKQQKISFSLAANDYGFILHSSTKAEVDPSMVSKWFSSASLLDDIRNSLNATEMAKRQFHEIARIAGLIYIGFPGERRSSRHLQASSSLIYDVFCEYDPQNMLLAQARNEVLQKQLEWDRLSWTVERLRNSKLVWRVPKKPTPLAFSLMVDRLRERVSSESLADRVRRMLEPLEKAAGD
jgi:ATP-dependent helicase Lhr and Lhr-like helicase